MQKSYGSCSNKNPTEATGFDTSRLNLFDITSLLNCVKETIINKTIKLAALQKLLIQMATGATILGKMLFNQNTTDSIAEKFVSIKTILSSFKFWQLYVTGIVEFVYVIQLMKSIYPNSLRKTFIWWRLWDEFHWSCFNL